MNTRVVASAGVRDWSAIFQSLLQLTKPGITRVVIATSLAGAVAAPGPVTDWSRLILALVGTVLVVAAANTLNMYLERDVDGLMQRTRHRPLPTGRLSPEVALAFGIALSAVGLPILAFGVNMLTALLNALALVSYVFAYTPLKRISSVSLYVGAVPGALPPVIGWAAMTDQLGIEALALFLLLFVWQIPHFHAIALFRQSEYERAGLRVYCSEKGVRRTIWAIIAFAAIQFVVSLMPSYVGLTDMTYTAVAVVVGSVFLGWSVYGLRAPSHVSWARSLFFLSMPVLVILYSALALSAA